MKITEHLKLATAIILLLCCVPTLHEWYRWIHYTAMLTFAVMAYHEYMRNKKILAVILGMMVIVFQPYVKLPIEEAGWDAIHVCSAVVLTLLWIKDIRRNT